MLPRSAASAVLVVGVVLAAVVVGAQPVRRPHRIGVLDGGFSVGGPTLKGLKEGLKAEGLVEGQDFLLDIRLTRGGEESPTKLAADLAGGGPDVIFATGEAQTRAAVAATSRVPIVFAQISDPVAAGLVASMARPGGRLTGISDLYADLVPKRLELARALVPSLRRVLMVYDSQDVKSAAGAHRAEEVGPQLKIPVVTRGVRTQEEAIRELKTAGSRDVILAPASNNLEITSLVLNLNLYVVAPAIFMSSFWVQGGGVASYGVDFVAEGAQAARLVARILRGARPEELPVEGANKIELTLNRKTAQAFGLTIPTSVQARADRVFERVGE
jgi:putative tryptophan/tyrosine transport system substrate-binding protein